MPKLLRNAVVGRLFIVKNVDWGSIASSTTATTDLTVTIKGLKKTAPLVVAMPSLEANLSFSNAHASAADTLKVRFRNTSGAAIDPAAQDIHVIQF